MKSATLKLEKSTDEQQLPYFHGALLDQDMELQLKNEGDFILQTKHQATDGGKPHLFLAVKNQKQIKRFEIKRSDSGQVRITKKQFDSVSGLIEYYQKEKLVVGDDKVLLKKPIARNRFQLHHSDIKISKKIGAGAYGTVYKGTLHRTGIVIAIKRIDSEGTDEQGLIEMMKEARVMQLYDHKNIVKFYGFIIDRMPYLLVMEFCDGGSVEDKLRSSGKKLTTDKRIEWTFQAARGMEYLHQKECIHRDIATRNLLLDKSKVKMADFGMCRPTSVYKVDLAKPMNVRWLAPEVWTKGETCYKTDVFAFAVLIWEMFEIPYKSPYSDWKAIIVKNRTMAGFRMQASEFMPEAISKIMEMAWHQTPEHRPTAREIRKLIEEAMPNVRKEKSRHTMSVD